MFKRILVPLDGSQLAESVLPVAAYLAEHLHSAIILFHAIEQGAPATIHGQRHLNEVPEAQAYLDQVAARLARPGVMIEKNVHPVEEAHVARSIIEHVTELNADLILLCAHGGGGLRGVLVGNIAQQVIQQGTTPVLFVRPVEKEIERPFECRAILIPLDGTPVHEPALPIAAELAEKCGAALRLLTVVPTTGTLSAERSATGMLLPATTTAVLELTQREAIDYLKEQTSRLLTDGIPTTASVVRGDPPTAILGAVEREKADLVVMATHGRGNLDAFWSGSVTPKVLSKTSVPVLLVRVMGEEAAR